MSCLQYVYNYTLSILYYIILLVTLEMEYPGLVSYSECTIILIINSNNSTLQLYGGSSGTFLHLLL